MNEKDIRLKLTKYKPSSVTETIDNKASSVTMKRYHFDVIESTQTVAINNVECVSGNEWCVFTAGQQEKGVGKDERQWCSPKGNVYATFVIPFETSDVTPYRLPLWHMTVLGVCQTLDAFDVKGSKLKWYNDALLDGKKISGSLVQLKENSDKKSEPAYRAVIGVGINVNVSPDVKGREVTSMKAHADKTFEVDEVFLRLQKIMLENISLYKLYGFSQFLKPVAERFAWLGQSVMLNGSKKIMGIFSGINKHGHLKLKEKGGALTLLCEGSLQKPELM